MRREQELYRKLKYAHQLKNLKSHHRLGQEQSYKTLENYEKYFDEIDPKFKDKALTMKKGSLPCILKEFQEGIVKEQMKYSNKFKNFDPIPTLNNPIRLPDQLKGLNSENLLQSLLTEADIQALNNQGRNSKIGGAFYLTVSDNKHKIPHEVKRILKERTNKGMTKE